MANWPCLDGLLTSGVVCHSGKLHTGSHPLVKRLVNQFRVEALMLPTGDIVELRGHLDADNASARFLASLSLSAFASSDVMASNR